MVGGGKLSFFSQCINLSSFSEEHPPTRQPRTSLKWKRLGTRTSCSMPSVAACTGGVCRYASHLRHHLLGWNADPSTGTPPWCTLWHKGFPKIKIPSAVCPTPYVTFKTSNTILLIIVLESFCAAAHGSFSSRWRSLTQSERWSAQSHT